MKVSDPAPNFSLRDQYGKLHSLEQYRGKWLVIYFYPKNNTPGCTTEACKFRDDYFKLDTLGATVFGVSIDNQSSHAAFAKKYSLPFPLLSDREGAVAKQYGSLFAFGPVRFARRNTFVVDPDGRIAKIYRSVDPESHSAQVIRDVKSLQGGGRSE